MAEGYVVWRVRDGEFADLAECKYWSDAWTVFRALQATAAHKPHVVAADAGVWAGDEYFIAEPGTSKADAPAELLRFREAMDVRACCLMEQHEADMEDNAASNEED